MEEDGHGRRGGFTQVLQRLRNGTLQPGALSGRAAATGAEKPGWRINVETPFGHEEIGVLLAPSHDQWRARIMTYPQSLWTAPGGRGALKFVAETREQAEAQAIAFVQHHVEAKRGALRNTPRRPKPATAPARAPPHGGGPEEGETPSRPVRRRARDGARHDREPLGRSDCSSASRSPRTAAGRCCSIWISTATRCRCAASSCGIALRSLDAAACGDGDPSVEPAAGLSVVRGRASVGETRTRPST